MMMRAGALRLLDGREAGLSAAVTLQVGASLDSPARTMRGVFALDGPCGSLGEVWVQGERGALFRGRVDRQQTVYSGQGLLLELEARSAGALLLDNEAAPCMLQNLQLGTLAQRCVAPYGFSLYSPDPGAMLGEYRIHKDTSEWEALCGFTRRALGITPHVEEMQVMVDRPRTHTALVVGGRELPLISLRESYIPYRMLSRVVLRDALGEYAAGVDNASAEYHGVRRRRYVIPSTEFVDAPAMDANARIRRSMLESGAVEVVLPGVVETRIGQEVEVRSALFQLYNLLVREVQWRLDATGVTTRLWLCSSVYYA